MPLSKKSNLFYEKKFKKEDYSDYVLGADIGGTNSRFAVAGIKKNKPTLLIGFQAKTSDSELTSTLITIIQYMKDNYKIQLKSACIGVAAFIEDENKPIKLTNSNLTINKKQILRKTKLKNLKILNDFEIIALSLNLKIKTKTIKRGKNIKSTKAIVGAGTGLGKSIAVPIDNIYVPIKSEGGHADFAFKSKQERKIMKSAVWEDFVSGKGIERIYNQITKAKKSAEMISKERKKNKACKKTMQMFAKFYARAVKNFSLNTLSLGGIYITGGIAEKNKDIFNKSFTIEFLSTSDIAAKNILKQIPIYLIIDNEASLKGACFGAKQMSRTTSLLTGGMK